MKEKGYIPRDVNTPECKKNGLLGAEELQGQDHRVQHSRRG